MRRHHRKPHLPERQLDDAQADDAPRQTLVNLQLLRSGPGIAPPMPLANSTGNDRSMSHWVRGKAGAGSPLQHQAKPAGSARALPRTPDPVSPRPHSPLTRVGEVLWSEGAWDWEGAAGDWDWQQSPAAPCLSNDTQVLSESLVIQLQTYMHTHAGRAASRSRGQFRSERRLFKNRFSFSFVCSGRGDLEIRSLPPKKRRGKKIETKTSVCRTPR